MNSLPLTDWADHLEQLLRGQSSPRRVMVFRSTPSTQDVVKQHADTPVVVVADEQTAGRGRLGRRWLAPPGSAVLFSLNHPLTDAGLSSDFIQCIAAVAVAQALEKLTGQRLIHIKWPNDIVVGKQKLAGILVETIATSHGRRIAVIGIGINVELSDHDLAQLPPDLRPFIATLRELGCQSDRLLIAAQVIANLDRQLKSPHTRLLIDEWRVRNVLQNHHVTFQSNGQKIVGTVIDVDPIEGLIVRTDTGELVHLHAATTTVL